MNNIRGFSLIEMLTVLVILGTIVSVGMPTLIGFISYMELQAETRKISSDLREYHHIAISKYLDCEFTFDLGNDSYTIEEVNPADSLDRETVKTVSVAVDIKTGSSTSVIFKPTGNTAAAATIILENDEGGQTTINVLATTGHVRIE